MSLAIHKSGARNNVQTSGLKPEIETLGVSLRCALPWYAWNDNSQKVEGKQIFQRHYEQQVNTPYPSSCMHHPKIIQFAQSYSILQTVYCRLPGEVLSPLAKVEGSYSTVMFTVTVWDVLGFEFNTPLNTANSG